MLGFLGVIFIPVGNFDDDVFCAVGNALAAEARFGRDAWRFVELIEFGIRGFVAGFEAFVNDDVAGGAGADAAAGVVETFVKALRDIEDAAGEAVVTVGDLLGVDFDRLAVLDEGDFVLLRRGREFCFFDVWVLAAHFLLLAKPEKLAGLEGRRYKRKANSKKPATLKGGATKIKFKGAGRRPAVQNTVQNRRQDTGATTDFKAPARGPRKLNVVEALAFQGCLQRAIHQDLGQVRGCLIQVVDVLANQFVIGAGHCAAKGGD